MNIKLAPSRIGSVSVIFASCVFLVYLCIFQVGNADFWWHVQAGEILLREGWIHTDPFAWTREGMPYLATHEWLAQILFAIVHSSTGALGIIMMRTILVLIAFCTPLFIHRSRAWMYSPFIVIAAASARPSLIDRPQLFTFAFFSATVMLCLLYLDGDTKRQRYVAFVFPIISLLWVNMHGAAVLAGIAVMGALGMQRIVDGAWRTDERRTIILTVLLVSLSLLITPDGYSSIGYLFSLSQDRSIEFIREWQPSPWRLYIQYTGIFAIPAILAFLCARRKVVFTVLLIVGMGYLSKTASRHEVLFILSSVAITIWQLRYCPRWNIFLEKLCTKPKSTVAMMLVIICVTGVYVQRRSYDVNRVDHLFGVGYFEPAKGAATFLDSTEIVGKIFNNYNVGGELLYRGYPERGVFLDGRNLDYGFEYINEAINAGVDVDLWRRLEQQYGFTVAVIRYDVQIEMDPVPYISILDQDPSWALVYLDDWVAVYLKRSPENTQSIALYEIEEIRPKELHSLAIPDQILQSQLSKMEAELLQMIHFRSDAIVPRIYLATLYTMLEMYSPAEEILRTALEMQPKNFRIYIALTRLFMEKNDWKTAWMYLQRALKLAGYSDVQVQEDVIQMVRDRAEHE